MLSPAPDPAAGDALFYRRLLAVAGLGVLALLLYRILQPLLAPLAWALFLAFLLQPAQRRLTAWLRGRASLAALLLTAATLLLFIGPLTALAIAFARQAGELAGLLRGWLERLRDGGLAGLSEQPALASLIGWLEQHLRISTVELQQWLLEGGKRLFEQLAALGGTAVLGAVGTIVSFTAMLFMLFFLVRDGATVAGRTLRLVPLAPARRSALAAHVSAVTRGVVGGTLLTALLQGVLLGAGFALVGLPAPVVFGALGAILSLVPLAGTALVWIPATLVLLGQGRYVAATVLTGIGLVVGTVDNFIKPMLISGQAVVPPLAVFIGALGGLAAFGMVGMFVGPVVIALALALLAFAGDEAAPPG